MMPNSRPFFPPLRSSSYVFSVVSEVVALYVKTVHIPRPRQRLIGAPDVS